MFKCICEACKKSYTAVLPKHARNGRKFCSLECWLRRGR